MFLQKLNGTLTGTSKFILNFKKPYKYCSCCYYSREPSSIVKPLKANASVEEQNKYNEKLQKAKPKAVRHLILVRHGQYNTSGVNDQQRYLTEMGKAQAAFTGERLKTLDIPWDKIIKSTMTRAQETGAIISSKIDNEKIPIENCSLLEEGAPIAPEPPIGHWKPEPAVSTNEINVIHCFKVNLFHNTFCVAAVLSGWCSH